MALHSIPQEIAGSRRRRAIIAGTAGNVMEWYDFAVYGYFASVIGREFFPAQDATSSLIAAFGVFAAGFLMRPIGSLVFGHIGDKTAGLDRVSVPGCRSGPAPAVHSASGQSQNAPRS